MRTPARCAQHAAHFMAERERKIGGERAMTRAALAYRGSEPHLSDEAPGASERRLARVDPAGEHQAVQRVRQHIEETRARFSSAEAEH